MDINVLTIALKVLAREENEKSLELFYETQDEELAHE